MGWCCTKAAHSEPRCFHLLLLRDADGFAIEWNLCCVEEMDVINLTLENNPVAMGHTIDVRLKSYAWFKPNGTFESVAAVNG